MKTVRNKDADTLIYTDIYGPVNPYTALHIYMHKHIVLIYL